MTDKEMEKNSANWIKSLQAIRKLKKTGKKILKEGIFKRQQEG